MKAKVKFDQAQLKSFCLRHGEKFVFALFVLTFFWLSWRALGVKPYAKLPDELKKASADANNKIETSTPPNPIPGLAQAPNFDRLKENEGAPRVDGTPYMLPSPWSRPLAERRVRRVEPKLLAPRQLIAYADFGVLAISRTSVQRSGPAGGDGEAMAGGMGAMGGMGGMGGMPTSEQMSQMRKGMSGMGSMGGPGGASPEEMSGMNRGMSGMPKAGKGTTRKSKDADKKRKAKEKADKEKEAARLAARKRRENEKHDLVAPSDSKPKGEYWICVVGLIPSREQFAEYSKVFRDATYADEFLDEPHWWTYDVQRAAVTSPAQDVDENDWEDIDVPAALKQTDRWPEYPELVDARYLGLCEPLPPVVSHNHRLETVCHPKIIELITAKPPEVKAPKTKKKSRNVLLGGKSSGRSTSRSGMGGMSRMGGMPTDMRGMGRGRGMGGMSSMGGMGQGMVGGSMGMGAYGTAKVQRAEYRLCRFFDLNVEPGKTYRYRIRLVMLNPNHNVPPRYLQSKNAQKLREGTTRTTDWCDACPPVTVPLGGSILAGDVKPAKGVKEPSIELMFNVFDKKQGVDALHPEEVRRGDLANYPDTSVLVPDPSDPSGVPLDKKLNIETGALLIDLAGGEKIPGAPSGLITPGRALIMSPTGELIIRSEARDAARYTDDKSRLKELKDLKTRKPAVGGSRGGDEDDPFSRFNEMSPGDNKKRGRRK